MHCSNAVRRAVRAQTLLAPHKGMQRHSDKNSSTLREDVSCWCWPNDCSRSGALQCTARYEDRTLRTPPRNSSGIAKSRLRDRRDSFIPSCLQGQDDNVATSACWSDSTFPGLLNNVCSCPLCTTSSSDATYTYTLAAFLHGWKRHSTGKPTTDRQLFWEFCFKETWRQ